VEKYFFYLISAVFLLAGIVILTTVVTCVIHADAIVEGRFKCDADNRVFDLMATLISSALALYAGKKS